MMMMMMILNCMLHLCKLSAASETSLREVISDEFMSAIVEAETNEYERLQMEWAVSESLQALNENEQKKPARGRGSRRRPHRKRSDF